MPTNEQMEDLWWKYQREGIDNHATPYSDALRNAIPYMAPEKIRENLFRTLDKLDALCADKTNVESLLRKEREAHEREKANAETRHKVETGRLQTGTRLLRIWTRR